MLNPIQGEGGVFDADIVSVVYETDPAVLNKIIPPGLKLRGGPFVQLVANKLPKDGFLQEIQRDCVCSAVTDERQGIDGLRPVALTLNSGTGDMGAFAGRACAFQETWRC